MVRLGTLLAFRAPGQQWVRRRRGSSIRSSVRVCESPLSHTSSPVTLVVDKCGSDGPMKLRFTPLVGTERCNVAGVRWANDRRTWAAMWVKTEKDIEEDISSGLEVRVVEGYGSG